jgi:hypothetical protein
MFTCVIHTHKSSLGQHTDVHVIDFICFQTEDLHWQYIYLPFIRWINVTIVSVYRNFYIPINIK